jgi:LAO/AO transport system kinase
MGSLASDDRTFIRPSPSGGSLGGVGRKTRETILVCEAAGYDVILVETVGVGQSETMVAEMVDFFLVLKLAGAGDELQGIKRGILELADLIAINKADGDNLKRAEVARTDFERAVEILKPARPGRWTPRVVNCSALERTGIDTIWETIGEHRAFHTASGSFDHTRRHQLIRWMWSMVNEGLDDALRRHPEVAAKITRLEAQILDGRVTATSAAREILTAFGID